MKDSQDGQVGEQECPVVSELPLCPLPIKEDTDSLDRDEDSDVDDFQTETSAVLESVDGSEVLNHLDGHPIDVKIECTDDSFDFSSVPVTQQSSGLVYRCKYCGQQLKRFSSLQQHEDAHRNGTIYKCRYCPYYSTQRTRIQTHERKHTGEKPFSCDLCDFRCTSVGDLKKHQQTHSSYRQYKCPLCPFRSKVSNGIAKHMRSHSDNRPFACSTCDGKFKTKSALENHMKLHSSVKAYHCNKCTYSCKTSNLLKLHAKVHSNVRNFPCSHPGCSQRCKTRSDLVKHMVVHMTSLDFKCVLCDKKFKSKQSLVLHTRRHVKNDLPCQICGKMLHSKQSLSRHIDLHNGEKKFECAICSHRFSNHSNLKIHHRVHDESRTFRCPLCISAYETVNHLFTHIGAAHGRDYVYFCEICQRPFSKYIMIKTHIQRNHKDLDVSGSGGNGVHEFVYNQQCCWSAEENEVEGRTVVWNDHDDMEQEEREERKPLNQSEQYGISTPESSTPQALLSVPERTVSEEITDNGDILPLTNSQPRNHALSDNNGTGDGIIDENEMGENKPSDSELKEAASIPPPCCSSPCPHSTQEEGSKSCHHQDSLVEPESGGHELVVKLERLSPASSLVQEDNENNIPPQSSTMMIGVKEQKCEKILKFGTYASVEIFLVGKDSGVKFSLKRGKKCSFSKWFMNPANMTKSAAERTKLYLRNQLKFSQVQESSRPRRKYCSSKVKEEIKQSKSKSVSYNSNDKSPKQKPSRKKPSITNKKPQASRRKKKQASSIQCQDVADELIDIKPEIQVIPNLISSVQNALCSSQEFTECSSSLQNSFDNSGENVHTNSAANSKKSKRNKKSSSSVNKKQPKSPKSKRVSKSKGGKRKSVNSSLDELSDKLVIRIKGNQCARQRLEADEGDPSRVGSLMKNGQDEAEPSAGEGIAEREPPDVVSSRSSSATEPSESAVVGVEKVLDSPFRITWKKVGGGGPARKRRKGKTEYDEQVLHQGAGETVDHFSGNGGEEVRRRDNIIFKVKVEDEKIKSARDEGESNLGNDYCETEGNSSVTKSVGENINEGASALPAKSKQKQELYSDEGNLVSGNGNTKPSSRVMQSDTGGIKVLSLEEFENEYKMRAKIVANISVTGNNFSEPLSQAGVVGKKRKKKKPCQDKTSKISKRCGKLAVKPDNDNTAFDFDHSLNASASARARKKNVQDESRDLFGGFRKISQAGANGIVCRMPPGEGEGEDYEQNGTVKAPGNGELDKGWTRTGRKLAGTGRRKKRKISTEEATQEIGTREITLDDVDDNKMMRKSDGTSEDNVWSVPPSPYPNAAFSKTETDPSSVNFIESPVTSADAKTNINIVVKNGNITRCKRQYKKRGPRCKTTDKTDVRTPVDEGLVSQNVHLSPSKIPKVKNNAKVSSRNTRVNSKKNSKGQIKVQVSAELFGMKMMSKKKVKDSKLEVDNPNKLSRKKIKGKVVTSEKESSCITKRSPGKKLQKKNVERGKTSSKPSQLKRKFKDCMLSGGETKQFQTSFVGIAEKKIKLPGLSSSDSIERRQTVECVTLTPKVIVTNLPTKKLSPHCDTNTNKDFSDCDTNSHLSDCNANIHSYNCAITQHFSSVSSAISKPLVGDNTTTTSHFSSSHLFKNLSRHTTDDTANKPLSHYDTTKDLHCDTTEHLLSDTIEPLLGNTNNQLSSDTTKKPLSSDTTNKSLSSDTTNKPLSSDTTNKPLSSDTTNKPLSSDTTNKSLSSDTTNKPLSSDTTNKSLSSDTTNKPLSSDTTNEPLSSDTTNKPLSSDTTNKPLSCDTTNKPLSTDTTNKPLSTDTTTKPLSSDTTNIPLSSDTTNKPLPSDTTNKPLPSDTTNNPLSSDTTKKPLSSDTTNKPLPSDTTTKPLSSDTTNIPLSSDTTNKPLPSDTTNKPLPSDTTNKPLPSDTTNKPLSSDTTNKPLPSDTTNKPLPSDTTNNPLSSDTTNKPLSSDTTNKPLPSDTTNNPLSSDITNKPLSSDTTNKPLSSDNTSKPLSECDTTNNPLSSDTTNKPLSSDNTSKPLSSDTATKPLSSDTTTKPLSSDTSTKPLSSDNTSKPLSECDTTNKPLSSDTTNKPLSSDNTSKPLPGCDTTNNPLSSDTTNKPLSACDTPQQE